jgi:hypothetical protein
MSSTPKPLLRPQYVALDSSHLGDIARDRVSNDPERRRKAEAFQARFNTSGCILLLCWHHMQELLSYDDDEKVATRIQFIRSQPMLAVVQSMTDDRLPGSVVDVQAREVKAAFDNPSADLSVIRQHAAATIVRLDRGEDIVRSVIEAWPLLKPELQRQGRRRREIVAISRSGFTGMEEARVLDMLNGKIRPREEIRRHLQELRDSLSSDMRSRGDKRIVNPEQSAAAFLEEVERLGGNPTDAREFGLAVLRAGEIDVAEIGPETTFRDIGRVITFRRKLRVLNGTLGLPWHELKAKVTENRLPSGVIQAAIQQCRPDTAEWKGSDLGDGYLACLAAYASVTYVDKRTHEALHVGRRKSPALASILYRVEKAGDYTRIVEQLVQAPP